MNSPSNTEFKKLLDQINLNFSAGNIQFSFSNECIHKASIPGAGDHNLEAGLNIDPGTREAEAEVEPYYFKKEFINVYFYQQHPGNGKDGFSWGQFDSKNEYVFSIFDAQVLTHELGHTLSLYHTRANTAFNNKATWECKEGSATLADMIEDTGGDPYNMDLDGNHVPDKVQWVNDLCNYNNTVHTYPDECGNTGPWNIPIDNFMFWDERRSCWNRFTPCQFSAMHNEISENLMSYTLDCGGQNNNSPCADIVIDDIISWTNEVKNLCANQRIIITANGHLTLVNTTLTKAVNNTTCPELSGNWGGIFIEGGNGISYPGGPNNPSGGSLTATSGSVIEYSNHGIQAEKGHLGILLSNCTLRLNPLAIHAGGPGGLFYGGSINLSSCSISNTSTAADPNMILANGCNVNITGSTLTNMSSTEVTGIKAYNNRVSIKSVTTIQGFKYGVDKEMSGNLAGLLGLQIENSKFLDGTNINHISIRNRGGSISAKRNWFGGKIDVAGKCNGNWYGNNFRKDVSIYNPSIAQRFLENKFFESKMDLNQDHGLTDAMCNIFEQTPNPVNGKLTRIKSEWGSVEVSSGNKPLVLTSQPAMEAYGTSGKINHYHWQPSGSPDPFFYGGKFSGSGPALSENMNCLYNVFP
ncbi:MAG: hypothetical protein IPM34_13750 [Saprospiraceae bacterium]|nr:hypothetical protein [Saprospiraceae bacterium]